ncbi:MAG: hypothetical protein AB1898_17360 [Acidobacteriota bacterium]
MKLFNPFTFVRQALRFYQAPGSLEYFDAAARIGRPGGKGLPKDLIHLGLRMHLRGLVNALAIQSNRDWIWPFWAERQFDPGDKSFIPRSHVLAHMNLTHRNWTILGPLNHPERCVVDPAGLVTPWAEGWSLDFWVATQDVTFFPSRSEPHQKIDPTCPLVKTRFDAGELRIKAQVFAAELEGAPAAVLRVRLVNGSRDEKEGRFFFSLRPYNPEGISLIQQLGFLDSHWWWVNKAQAVFLPEAPQRVFCSNLEQGDVSFFLSTSQQRKSIECDVGLATGLSEYRFRLGSQEKASYTAVVTLAPSDASRKKLQRWCPSNEFRYGKVRQAFAESWHRHLSAGAHLSFPNRRLTQSFEASKVHLHAFDRGPFMTPGALTYSLCWVRDSAFMLNALDKLGYHQQVEQKLLAFSQRQDSEGYFAFQEGEWDANGLALWSMVQHFRLTGNRELLDHLYPAIARGAEWIERKRHESRLQPEGYQGLLPAGISAEHLGSHDHYYWDNFWGVAGLHAASEAAKTLNRHNEADRLARWCQTYRADVEHSLLASAGKTGVNFLPASPFRRVDSGAVGSLCAVYPLGLIAASDPRVLTTLSLLEQRFFHKDGLFQDHFHSGVNCYLSAHVAQCHLAAGNARAWRIVRYLLKHASGTFTWPEAFHPRTKGGCMGEGHHGWATADWLLLLRNLLLREEGDRLDILPAWDDGDLQPGTCFSATAAPCFFGRIHFKVWADRKELLLEVEPDFFLKAPSRIRWNLPFTPSRLSFNGVTTPCSSPAFEFPAAPARIVAAK